jgi:hypothetical protein
MNCHRMLASNSFALAAAWLQALQQELARTATSTRPAGRKIPNRNQASRDSTPVTGRDFYGLQHR